MSPAKAGFCSLLSFSILLCIGCEEPAEELTVLPGITKPPVVAAADSKLADEAIVIGVSVGDSHRAYLLDAFKFPERPGPFIPELARVHVVNDVVDGKAVTVTHCDKSHCTKVFWNSDSDRPLTVGITRVKDGKMHLSYGGQEFDQGSADAPLTSLHFETMKWKEWRELHPATTVYE